MIIVVGDQRLPCSRHGFKCSTCIYTSNSPNNPLGHCFIITLYRQGSEGTVQLGNWSEVIQPSYCSLTTLRHHMETSGLQTNF